MGVLAVALGSLTLAGWVFDLEILKSAIPGLTPMYPETAFGFLLAGASLCLSQREATAVRRASLILAGTAAILGLAILMESALGVHPGVAGTVLPVDRTGKTQDAPLGHMSPVTAACFLSSGAAIIVAALAKGALASQVLAAVSFVLAYITCVGYAFRAEPLYVPVAGVTPMALPTAAGHAALGIGIFFLRGREGVARFAATEFPGGVVVRNACVAALATLVLLGWLANFGGGLGVGSSGTLSALLLLALLVMVLASLGWSSLTLRRVEAERRDAVEQVRRSEAHFRAMAEAMPQLGWITRPDGLAEWFNGNWSRYTGLSLEESLGRGWVAAIHPDDRERCRAVWARAVETGTTYEIEYRLLAKDGASRWHLGRGSPLRKAEGTIVRWFGTCTDIHDQKETEDALRVSKRDLELHDRIRHVLLTVENETMYEKVLSVILEATRSDLGVFGYLDETGDFVVPTMTWKKVWEQCRIPEKGVRYPRATWGDSAWPTALREGRTVWSNERSGRVPEGHVPILRQISVPLLCMGKPVGLFQVANKPEPYDPSDVALLETLGQTVAPVLASRLEKERQERARQRFEAELLRSNNDLQEFAFVASHDLQEPLRKLAAFGERLRARAGTALDGESLDYLSRMEKATARMGDLVEGLLNLARVASRGHPFGPVRLDDVLREVLADLEIPLRESGARVEARALPVIVADRLQIRQLLHNLIGNALKFRHPARPPVITVSATSHADGLWRIEIRDNGIGFDEKYLDRLFKPFQRLHGRSEYPGTGMGLAICRRIVERHGGRITASSSPGVGSCFRVTLPRGQSRDGGPT